jgi:hypothetical protein
MSLADISECGHVHCDVFFYSNMTPSILRKERFNDYPFCCLDGAKHYLQQLNTNLENMYQHKFMQRQHRLQQKRLSLALKNLQSNAC